MSNPQFKVLDLFSGIGGFSLGLERTGHFKTIAFCEIDNYCQRLLHKHWPEVYIHSDIRTLTARNFEGWQRPNFICGGFPCQDISNAGRRAGISEGTRSGLWGEFARLVGELRPEGVLVENVAALLERGMGRVIGDLADMGYDAEWATIPACILGAPHCRERVWIVAYPQSDGFQGRVLGDEAQGFLSEISASRHWASGLFADWQKFLAEPVVRDLVDGFPNRVAELTALGNSIVPQIAEWIGRRIIECEQQVEG